MKSSLFFLVLSLVLLGNSAARAEDRALIVGTDVYADVGIPETLGAVDDALAMEKLLLEKFGFKKKQIKLLLNKEAKAANIVGTFQTWLVDGTNPGDRVFFFYAGHGFQTPDNNRDEEDGQDEAITPYDVVVKSENGKIVLPDETKFVRDDLFNDFITQLVGRRTVLVFDSCHSGTMSRSLNVTAKKGSRFLSLTKSASRSIGDNAKTIVPPKGSRDLFTIREDATGGSPNGGVVILSAASPYQEAFPIERDGITRGAFSYLFETQIRQNQNISVDQLAKNLTGEMKKLAGKNEIGQSSTTNEYQVPQMEIIARSNLGNQPLFSASPAESGAAGEAVATLYNPISAMRVRLEVAKKQYRLDDKINYTAEVGEAAYLYILVFSGQDQAFCIFPSPFIENPNPANQLNYVNKGRHSFPRASYETIAMPPTGKDVWVALVSKKKLNLGEKEAYSWDEMFERIGIPELRKKIAANKSRGAGNVKTLPLDSTDDWQASSVVVEVIEK